MKEKRVNIMKKKVLAIALVVGALLTGCGSKEPVSAATFTEKAQDQGFEVIDMTEYEDIDGATAALFAMNDDDVEIMFIEGEDTDFAKNYYELTKTEYVNAYEEGSSVHTDVNVGNSQKYTVKNGDVYATVERVDNTIVYVETSTDYRDAVKSLLDELNY